MYCWCLGATINAEDEATCFGEYGCKLNMQILQQHQIWYDGRYECKFTTLVAGNNSYYDGEYACRLNTISDVIVKPHFLVTNRNIRKFYISKTIYNIIIPVTIGLVTCT